MTKNELTRRIQLSVDPSKIDPWDVLDLGGWDAFADYLLGKVRGLHWRDAAILALGVHC